jgi:hypothetical protein
MGLDLRLVNGPNSRERSEARTIVRNAGREHAAAIAPDLTSVPAGKTVSKCARA